jgi:SAM-dependent methyltransferase
MTDTRRFTEVSERDRLLLRAAVGRGPGAARAWKEWIGDVDLDVIDYPEARLLTQVFANLNAQSLAGDLPSRIRGKYRWVWSSNQLRCRAVAPGLQALAQSGVPTMLLKGGGLLAAERCRWGAREMGDVDILVATTKAGRAAAVLESQGWLGAAGVSADYLARRLVNRRHSWNFIGPPSGALDLHWHLMEGIGGNHADDLLWRSSRATTFGDVAIRRLADTDHLVHTIEHASHREPAHRLVWLVDAAYLLHRADPRRLLALSQVLGVQDLVAEGLDVAGWALESLHAAELAQTLSKARRSVRERLLKDANEGRIARRFPRTGELVRVALAQGMSVSHPLAGARAMVRRCVEPDCVHRPVVSAPLALLGRPRRMEVALVRVGGPLGRPPASRRFSTGTWIDLASAGMLDMVGGPGWAWPEPDRSGVWADGAEAKLVLDVDALPGSDLLLSFLLGSTPRVGWSHSVRVSVNGRPLIEWDLARSPEREPRRVEVPAWLAGWCRPLEVTFRPRYQADPAMRLAEPADRRHFLQLRGVRVDTRADTPVGGDTRSVVEAWDNAAGRPDARVAINPLGTDPAAYERSGEEAAAGVAALIGDDPELVVVDFGAGDGRVTLPLARHYRRVIAIDSSPTMLARLRTRSPNVETVLADGTDPRQLPADVHAVIALAVLIHHRHEDAARIIVGLASMLRRGGVLLLDLPLYEMSREPDHWTDVSVWTLGELETLTIDLNLEIVNAPVSPGQFDEATLGPNHGQVLVLRKI